MGRAEPSVRGVVTAAVVGIDWLVASQEGSIVISVVLGGKYSHLVTLVDDEDLDDVALHRWTYFQPGRTRTAYARRRFRVGDRQVGETLHTFLTGWSLVDHINGDGLDNRRANLRPATSSENSRNSRKPVTYHGRPCSSQFKGVCWMSYKESGYWRAFIKVNYKQISLGIHKDEVLAAQAYDNAARHHFGEYAKLNFPEEG